jgi:hypothetical protein
MYLVIKAGHTPSAAGFAEAFGKRWFSTSHGGCGACPRTF